MYFLQNWNKTNAPKVAFNVYVICMHYKLCSTRNILFRERNSFFLEKQNIDEILDFNKMYLKLEKKLVGSGEQRFNYPFTNFGIAQKTTILFV